MVSIARCGYATFIRNWIVTLRAYPWSFFISGLMGGVFTVALAYFTFHLLASGQLGQEFTSYTGTADYMSYIILGTAILTFSVINIMLGISRSMITERREGTLESLLLAPAKRGPYFSGVTAQWALNSLVETALMLLVTWPLGLKGTMSFFAGVRIPLFAFPLWIRIIGILFPLTTSLVVLRGALLEGATPATLWPQLLFLAGISGALFAAAAWLLKRGEENARRSGSLTLF